MTQAGPQPLGKSYIWRLVLKTTRLTYLFLLAFGFWQSLLLAQPCLPVVNLGGQVAFCQGNSLLLDATNPGANYLWSTGAQTPTLLVSTSGTYWVRVTNSCGSVVDSVDVFVDQQLNLNLGPDRPYCGSPFSLSVPQQSSYQYLWSTGDTGATALVDSPGVYSVRVSNGCGTFGDSLWVFPAQISAPQLGADRMLCQANRDTLGVANPYGSLVLWQGPNGFTASSDSIVINQSGRYYVTMSNACGQWQDSIYVQLDDPPNLGLPSTAHLCGNNGLQLNPTAPGSYQWSHGPSTAQVTLFQPGTYTVNYSNACTTLVHTITLSRTPAVSVQLGPDTLVCHSLRLDADTNATQYLWDNGDTNRQRIVYQTGTYWVRVSRDCLQAYDSIYVEVQKVPELAQDTFGICLPDTIPINAGAQGRGAQYFWSNSDTGRIGYYHQVGQHWVEIVNACDTTRLDFWILQDQGLQVELKDTSFCDTMDVYFRVPPRGPTDLVIWSNGMRDVDSIRITQRGMYWVEIMNACDTVRDSAYADVYPRLNGFGPGPIYKCAQDSVAIAPGTRLNTQYLWSTGDSTRSIYVQQAGTYWVRLSHPCDTLFDTIQVVDQQAISFNLGPDRQLCVGDTHRVFLPSQAGFQYFLNGNSLALPYAFLSQSGSYIFEVRNSCGGYFDTLNLSFEALPRKKLQPSEVFCSGGSLSLDVSQPQATYYRWDNGSTSPVRSVSQDGLYWVEIGNRCDTIVDSCQVNEEFPLPSIDLGNDTIFCEGTMILRPGQFMGARYRWSNGAGTQSLLVTQSGRYWVEISNSCNTVSDTIDILITGPPQRYLGTETRYCASNNFFLNAQNPGSRYLWNTGDTTQSIQVNQSGRFWVHITNDCGAVTDSVDVIQEFPLNQLSLGPDTAICRGDSLWLVPQNHQGAALRWDGQTNTDSILVWQSGLYRLRARNHCGDFFTTRHVEVLDTPYFELRDSLICSEAGSLTLRGPKGMQEYEWSNGQQTRGALFQTAGQHWLRVSNGCFSYTDSFYLKAEDPIEWPLPNDTAVCISEGLFLDFSDFPYPIFWEDGRQAQQRHITSSGIYRIGASNSCGYVSQSFRVQMHPQIIDSLREQRFCRGDSLLISPEAPQYQWRWWDGSTSESRVFSDSGRYALQIENACGSFALQYWLREENCDCPVYMAKAFTPNGDGLNDLYQPFYDCAMQRLELIVYDRWGQTIVQQMGRDARAVAWDGKIEGKEAPGGVYLYHLRYHWQHLGQAQSAEQRGHFSLIR